MKLALVAILVVCVVAAVFADEPCNLQCEPNHSPVCVRDTKTNKTETMYNYCMMLQSNQCRGGSYVQVSTSACPSGESSSAESDESKSSHE